MAKDEGKRSKRSARKKADAPPPSGGAVPVRARAGLKAQHIPRSKDNQEAVEEEVPTPAASTLNDVVDFGMQDGGNSAAAAASMSPSPPSLSPTDMDLQGGVTSPPAGVEIEVPTAELGLESHAPDVDATDIPPVRGPDPEDRIRLSEPGAVQRVRVTRQANASQQDLERLLETLNGFRGVDAEDETDRDNKQQIPMSEDDLAMLREVLRAAIALHRSPTFSGRIINILREVRAVLKEFEETFDQLAATSEAATRAFMQSRAAAMALGVLLDHLM